MPKTLSVVLITLNEAANLPRTLAGVGWAQEIVVLDSGSTDATKEIAKSLGARLIEEPRGRIIVSRQRRNPFPTHLGLANPLGRDFLFRLHGHLRDHRLDAEEQRRAEEDSQMSHPSRLRRPSSIY